VVNTLPGVIQTAKLRLYTTEGTTNGSLIYATGNVWLETAITWQTRPASTSSVANKGVIEANAWVEYDVTSLINDTGTYSFVLVADSADGVSFSSQEGSFAPQLVLRIAAGLLDPDLVLVGAEISLIALAAAMRRQPLCSMASQE